MKNKIVKALVLASIVSMTATGAAGLTFADENVATGDTATSTTDTATKKTVDDLEADLAKAQKTAGEKEADFTEKLAAYTEAAKPVDPKEIANLKDAYVKSVKPYQTALTAIATPTRDVEQYLERINPDDPEVIDSIKIKGKYNAYKEARNTLKGKSMAYADSVREFMACFDEKGNVVDQSDPATKLKAIEDKQKEYKEAKTAASTAFDEDVSEVVYGSISGDLLAVAIPKENKAISAFEEALENLVSAGKAVVEYPESETEREAALKEAKENLKKATEAYKKALTDLGTAKSAYEEATADLVQIYRLYHPATHEHLWTKDANEKNVLSTERGWIYEGVAWLTKKKGTDAVPLYRLVYPFSGDHHYTTSENEVKDLTTKYGWISEDVAFYVPKEGDVPVYRLFNPGLKMGAHHFTTGENEYNTLGERGWTKENVAYKVSAKGALDTSEIKTEDSRIADAEKIYVEQP